MNIKTTKDKRRIWFVGVVLPLLMLAFDPIVFRCSEFAMESAILGKYKPLFYTAILLAILVYSAWHGLGRAPAFLSGAIGASALFAAALGCGILPTSMIGLIVFGIGLFGLTPFFVAIVYFLSARDAGRIAKPGFRHFAMPFTLGFLLIFSIPFIVQHFAEEAVRKSLADIDSEDSSRVALAASRLKRWAPLLVLDFLLEGYPAHFKPSGKQLLLGQVYEEATGREAWKQAEMMND